MFDTKQELLRKKKNTKIGVFKFLNNNIPFENYLT
jgi:hypothetical protein